MLKAHLDPTTDAANRKPETIRATVDHLVTALEVTPGSRILDLGCGPGLYATQFARRGLLVTGVDLSPVSVTHARKIARADGVDIDFRVADYTRTDLGGPFDAALLIYLDFGVLADDARDRLLTGVQASLRPGGTRDGLAAAFTDRRHRRKTPVADRSRPAIARPARTHAAACAQLAARQASPESLGDLTRRRAHRCCDPPSRSTGLRAWFVQDDAKAALGRFSDEELGFDRIARGHGFVAVRATAAGRRCTSARAS
jgi:SAM-dependent methyltransferase